MESAAESASQKELRVFIESGHPGPVNSVAMSPDGKYALPGSYSVPGLILWDASSGRQIHSFGYSEPVSGVDFSPDGKFAISGGTGLNI